MGCIASLQKSLAAAVDKAFTKNTSRQSLVLLLVLALYCAGAFGQTTGKQKQSGKKAQAASSGKSAGEQTQEKKEAANATSAESSEGEEEAKGPWHGLTWRLIGPYRGGRVLAVSGVVGDPHTYYFGATGGGVWKTTD